MIPTRWIIGTWEEITMQHTCVQILWSFSEQSVCSGCCPEDLPSMSTAYPRLCLDRSLGPRSRTIPWRSLSPEPPPADLGNGRKISLKSANEGTDRVGPRQRSVLGARERTLPLWRVDRVKITLWSPMRTKELPLSSSCWSLTKIWKGKKPPPSFELRI